MTTKQDALIYCEAHDVHFPDGEYCPASEYDMSYAAMRERVKIAKAIPLGPDENPSPADYYALDVPILLAEIERKDKALSEALTHVEELEDAWSRGCISEHDGLGGIRSNRNVTVRVSIRAALAPVPDGASGQEKAT